jgi:hypothetical protein
MFRLHTVHSDGTRFIGSLDLDQGCPIGVPVPLGMNSADETPRKSKEEAKPPRVSAFLQVLEDYASDLRAIIRKLRRKLN